MSVQSISIPNFYNLFAGTLSLESTINSTSISTGTLVIDGGAGITKDLFVGGNINFGYASNSVNFSGPWSGTVSNTLYFWKIGDIVNMYFGVAPGSTNASAVSITAPANSIPVGYRASGIRYAPLMIHKIGALGAVVLGNLIINPDWSMIIEMANSTYSSGGNVPDNTWQVLPQIITYLGS